LSSFIIGRAGGKVSHWSHKPIELGSIPRRRNNTGEDCGGTPRYMNPKDAVLIRGIRAGRV